MAQNLPSVLYQQQDRIAYITLNRPEKMNAINETMPDELKDAVAQANNANDVHVIVLQGAGNGFCSGYDLEIYAEQPRPCPGSQNMPWDATVDFRLMQHNNNCFMSLWHSYKPVICKLHGFAVAGGSDIALCCDLIIMDKAAKIGYPPARLWGCPTTAMWIYRVGAERAKRLLFTGDLINGEEAAQMGLVSQAVPTAELDATVNNLATRIASVPQNQLMLHKLMINQAFENMGLATTQMFALLFDGIARHSPEGVHFKQRAEESGFKQAIKERDSNTPLEINK